MVCRRYPGRRPSDYFEDIDSYSAFELDIATALRFELQEQDERMDLVEAITQGYSLRQVAQGLAGKRKLKEPPKRQRLTKDAETEKAKDNDGLFDIAAIRKQAGRTVVEGTDG